MIFTFFKLLSKCSLTSILIKLDFAAYSSIDHREVWILSVTLAFYKEYEPKLLSTQTTKSHSMYGNIYLSVTRYKLVCCSVIAYDIH